MPLFETSLVLEELLLPVSLEFLGSRGSIQVWAALPHRKHKAV